MSGDGDHTVIVVGSDGTRLVTGSKDQTARVWDTRDGRQLFILKGHVFRVTGVAFSSTRNAPSYIRRKGGIEPSVPDKDVVSPRRQSDGRV